MIVIQCNNNFGVLMTFIGNPSDKLLAFLLEQVEETRNYKPPTRTQRIKTARGEGKTMREIGEAEKLSEQRVGQILAAEKAK